MRKECPNCNQPGVQMHNVKLASKRKCVHCGKSWYETEDFCRECGKQLGAGYLCDDCDSVEVLE